MNDHVSSKLLPIFPFQTVFRTLVSQILDRVEPLLPSSLPLEVVTVFQYYGYFTSHGVSDLESHVNQLAKQGGTRFCHTVCWLPVESALGFLVIAFSEGSLFFPPKSTAGIRSAFSVTFRPLTLVSLSAMKQGFTQSVPITQQDCNVDEKLLNDVLA